MLAVFCKIVRWGARLWGRSSTAPGMLTMALLSQVCQGVVLP